MVFLMFSKAEFVIEFFFGLKKPDLRLVFRLKPPNYLADSTQGEEDRLMKLQLCILYRGTYLQTYKWPKRY
jgi:hypothetical protein